jgi:hypothetical protein
MNYYYFSATLPTIAIDRNPGLRVVDFVEQCRLALTPEDQHVLEALLTGREEQNPHPFAVEWRAREAQLRNCLAWERAERLGHDPATYLRPESVVSTSVEQVVEFAFQKETPLEREQVIDRFRWRQLEDLAGLNGFSSSAIFSYGLRLQISERWSSMDDTKASERIEAMTSAR